MKRPITVISIISIFLFIIALAWFGIGIYEDGKSGSEQNERVFETLVFKTMSAANSSKIGTPEFSKKFIDAIGNIESYSSLKLNVNGKLVYSYPPAGFSLPSAALTNSFRKTNSSRDGLLITVSASMYAIKTNSVYHYAKFAFVLILLGTSISLLLLLILSGNKKPDGSKIKELFARKNKKEEDSDEIDIDFGDDGTSDSDSIFNLPDDEEIIFADDDDSGAEKITPEEKSDEKLSEDGQPLPFTTDISEDDFEISDEPGENQKDDKEKSNENSMDSSEKVDFGQEDQKTEELKTEPEEDIKEQTENEEPASFDFNEPEENSEEKTANEEKPLAIDFNETDDEEKTKLDEEHPLSENEEEESPVFDLDAPAEQISPATGLKLQSALLPELDKKIEISLEKKSELTLALLKVNGLDRGNSISNKIVEILKDEIENPDEIYEYNSDGYAIILENEDLSSCADIFDDIYEKITSFLKENNSINEVVIGLSSVDKRNVDAKRLVTEADQALEHALEDPDSPIIAFRANPEKYKEYLDSQEK